MLNTGSSNDNNHEELVKNVSSLDAGKYKLVSKKSAKEYLDSMRISILNNIQIDNNNLGNKHDSMADGVFLNKESMREEFIVVDPKGQTNTIQGAVDSCTDPTKQYKIQIYPGLYNEQITINKPNISLESYNLDDLAVIVGEDAPCIKIVGLEDTDVVKISNLKITNRGIQSKSYNHYEQDYSKAFIYENSHLIENLEVNFLMDPSIIDGVIKENQGKISGISIFSGILIMNNCKITLSILSTYTNIVVPAIYTENSGVFLEKVIIKGNKDFYTSGILINRSSAKVVDCKIFHHNVGGVMATINKGDKVSFVKTNFTENTGTGIFCKGQGEIVVEYGKLEKNHGSGVKIIDCSNISILSNEISENLLHGCEIINCNGLVMMNNLFKNKGNGLLLETCNGGSLEARFLNNAIHENCQNGMIIRGANNNAKICLNSSISSNNFSGIMIREKASPKILENKIFENMNQGILIVSDSYAKIEKNEIYKNIKANIAFGGKLSERTEIIDNKIYSSRNEGIYAVQATKSNIQKNEIYDNNDGIIIANSSPIITDNKIFQNVRCAVIVCEESEPEMIGNKIIDNHFLGLFIREKSKGMYRQNELRNNISQLYLAHNCLELLPDLEKDNTIEGRKDLAKKCVIF